ncbi:hypothetical protein CERSUDRAFT_95063 [Gelatoporia subvermispora B]|uniref:Nephrocystin 3-like N-terminal domain-containing protein n=1 Tax=Ceriporiopsis subvermispora (strain B) TaxID=914234 RepID=M2QIC7_CERS8|nr:hypothetical protein CERSUDRAFT_95063 [Gelatoporia subvermispora B]
MYDGPMVDPASGSGGPAVLDAPRVNFISSARKTGWIVLKEVPKAVRDGSDLFPLLKAAAVEVFEIMDIVDNIEEVRDGFEQIAQDISRLLTIISQYGTEPHMTQSHKKNIKSKTKRSLLRRVFESRADVKEVESMFRGLAAMLNDFPRLLAQLQHVPDAGVDAQAGDECMQGTRVTLLDDLKVWSKYPAAPHIFWLDGLGTNRDDIKRIIPTLAVSLAYQCPAYKAALLRKLRERWDAGHDKVEIQMERLLRGPLYEAFGSAVPALVLVIDVLDECADVTATSRILMHLLQISSQMPIKFFITSRPEQHIRSQLERGDTRMRRLLRQALLEGHTNRVHTVTFSSDGTHIMSGSSDGTIRIWDAITGQTLLKPLHGHTAPVNSVAFSPDESGTSAWVRCRSNQFRVTHGALQMEPVSLRACKTRLLAYLVETVTMHLPLLLDPALHSLRTPPISFDT